MISNTIARVDLALPFLLSLTSLARAQSTAHWIEAQDDKLTASTPSAVALFGRAVAKSGSILIIGAPLDDNATGNDAGAAYLLRPSGSFWTEVAELIGSGNSATDLFGEAVGVSGETVVVGANLDDPNNIGAAGSAYVFNECSGFWTEVTKLLDPNPAVGDRFGYRVAIDGDTIAVSAFLDDTCAVDAGRVFLYARVDPGTPNNPCDDQWVLQAEVSPTTCQAGQLFGSSMALSGNRLLVGAPGEDGPEQDRGAAYVFERNGSTWTQSARLTALDGAAGDGFGNSVALDDDSILIGASFDDSPEVDRGSAYVFRWLVSSWYFEQKLTSPAGRAFDAFGFQVDISGELAVVSATGSDDAGESTGSVSLFRRESSVWTQDQYITAGDAAAGDEFGSGLLLDGSNLIVGAQRDDDALNSSGSAYSFFLSEGRFELYGYGDGSATACPCGNQSLPRLEQGCVNSTGWGGKLSIVGSDSASADNFRLIANNLLPGNPALLYHGPNMINGGAGLVFGNGLRLVGGAVVRAGVFVPDASGRAAWGPGLGQKFPWVPGMQRRFQVWYRDPFHASCGNVFNLTNAVSVTFAP